MEEIKFILGLLVSILILYVTVAYVSKLVRDYRLTKSGAQSGLAVNRGVSRPKKGTSKERMETTPESRPSGSAHKHILS